MLAAKKKAELAGERATAQRREKQRISNFAAAKKAAMVRRQSRMSLTRIPIGPPASNPGAAPKGKRLPRGFSTPPMRCLPPQVEEQVAVTAASEAPPVPAVDLEAQLA